MKLDLTPRQVEVVRGSISRTLIDMGAECFEQNTYDNEPLSDYCREINTEMQVLNRVLAKLNGVFRADKPQ